MVMQPDAGGGVAVHSGWWEAERALSLALWLKKRFWQWPHEVGLFWKHPLGWFHPSPLYER